jgi:hypothetical protein
MNNIGSNHNFIGFFNGVQRLDSAASINVSTVYVEDPRIWSAGQEFFLKVAAIATFQGLS